MRVSLIYKGMLGEPTIVRNGRPGNKCIANSACSHVANLLLKGIVHNFFIFGQISYFE